MTRVLLAIAAGISAIVPPVLQPPRVDTIPPGFVSIFNGTDTSGWHWSRTVHHGTTAVASVENGVLVLQQHPFGQGGLLLTDKRYTDFELHLEARPDPGALLSEQMRLSTPSYIGPRGDVNTLWKDGDWNSMRVRMIGEAPRITLWINGQQLWDAQMPRNDQVAGVYGGMIGLQLHWTATYTEAARGLTLGLPWTVQRFRNLAIREIQ